MCEKKKMLKNAKYATSFCVCKGVVVVLWWGCKGFGGSEFIIYDID